MPHTGISEHIDVAPPLRTIAAGAQRFLIAGTPRSRTAWLAALCNTVPGTICYHEPIAYHPTWQATARLWEGKNHERIGISDSGFSFHIGALIAMYRPRILIVDRPEAEVYASLAAVGIPLCNYHKLVMDALEPWRDHSLVRSVPFDALADNFTLHGCLWHLLPGAAIDMDKVGIFQRLNVQTDMRQVWKDAEGRDMREIIGLAAAGRLRAV